MPSELLGSRLWLPALLWMAALLVAVSSTGPATASETDEIERLLSRLVRVASLYRHSALGFECREAMTHTVFGKGKHAKNFAYLFVHDDEEESPREYRLTRRQIKKESTLEEANPDDHGIKLFLHNAYLFMAVFEERRQPFYRYSLEGEEDVLGRRAKRLFVEPRAPMRSNLNEWLGWFWIDSETTQVLKVEAYQAESAVAWLNLQADLGRAENDEQGSHRDYEIEKVTVEFGVERNGMRFPSHVEILQERYDVWGGRPTANKIARTTQVYSDYRFFEIKTAEEISAWVGGGDK